MYKYVVLCLCVSLSGALCDLNKEEVTAAAVLVSAHNGPLGLTGDFDSQLRHILREEMLSAEDTADILSRVLGDVQSTLEQRWQGLKLTPYGSLTTGLGTKSSDVDISLQLPNFNSSADSYVLQEAEKLLLKQPALYSCVNRLTKPRHPFVSFYHIPYQREVNLVFRNGAELSVHESKIVKYYFNLDTRSLLLVHFLKLLFRIHGLTFHELDTLPNFALDLMTIFYLQQKNMAPPVYVLQANSKSHFVDNWDVGFNELPYSTTNTDNLHKLLGGFFKYYSEFNFEEYIVSPFTGRPIPKSAFKDIENFPQEYTLRNNTWKRTIQFAIQNKFNMSSDVCVQKPFELDKNGAERLAHEHTAKFKYLLKSAATMFEHLPGDSILGAILENGNRKLVNIKDTNKDGIIEQDY